MSKIEETSVPVLEVKAGMRPGYINVRITQKLIKTLDVVVVTDECYLCNKETPLPDAKGMRFLLDHAEDNRVVWPKEEDVNKERDQYPVKGWKRLDDRLICGECYKEFREFANAKRMKT